jgi:hypothetical protein
MTIKNTQVETYRGRTSEMAEELRSELIEALREVNPHNCTCSACIRDSERASRLIKALEENTK